MSLNVGLDPAGPNWDLPGCAADPVTCRLNPQDASQVSTTDPWHDVSGLTGPEERNFVCLFTVWDYYSTHKKCGNF